MSTYEKMDRMYRYQRYIYDLTREYYLLGRDRLIDQLEVADGDTVLEVGFGTGRNLALLAAKYPAANFIGIDASSEMLKTAESKMRRRGIRNVELITALAEEFDFGGTLGLQDRVDAVFFSYSISMIPMWREAVLNALDNVKAGRPLYVVDFFDQRGLPLWFGRILASWLRQFEVRYPPELVSFFERLEAKGMGKFEHAAIFRSYSFISRFEKL